MPPKASQSTSTQAKPAKKAKTKATTVKLGDTDSKSSRLNPLTAFANTPTPPNASTRTNTPTASQSSQNLKGKGKGKAKETLKSVHFDSDAVHVKKVQDVRRWLDEALVGGPSGKLRKYRRILALTGPAGTAKTATMRVLAREMQCELLEWRNAMGESSSGLFDEDRQPPGSGYAQTYDSDQEGLFSKFEAFLTRASTCQTIFTDSERDPKLSSSQSSSSSRTPTRNRQIILLEDLPNILHANTQSRFHAALQAIVTAQLVDPIPIVIIVSDAGLRGEASDERLASGSWGKGRDGVLDVRTIIPKDLLHGPYVTQIGFNPIAPTLMKKALQALISSHFSSPLARGPAPSKETLDIIIETSNGDIRSAIMALQFSCIVEPPSGKGRRKSSSANAKLVLEAVTRREQSLHLFHLIGKVLYNKRKGDPPNPSATAKDIQKDKDLDATLQDPPNLPSHLAHYARRTSRVNIDLLYANSPIDSSLFSLYIHQNYSQFCNEVEECGNVADWLSWIDSSGGEAWYQANPHQFHLLTIGTLHSLPTPDAWDAVRDVRGWIVEDATLKASEGWQLGGWSGADVVIGLGGVLKARDAKHTQPQAPSSHRMFSSLTFASSGNGPHQLGEGDLPSDNIKDTPDDGGWLETDDIEDF
ncbi:Rad17-domain-containing protein [Favolaschia claudopus]|uniref:Rad17-domain-containing protein n=1 Tax=Favolaschia claudopus TaxID=2862362 RepID=A0AAW0DWM0_9AGAR